MPKALFGRDDLAPTGGRRCGFSGETESIRPSFAQGPDCSPKRLICLHFGFDSRIKTALPAYCLCRLHGGWLSVAGALPAGVGHSYRCTREPGRHRVRLGRHRHCRPHGDRIHRGQREDHDGSRALQGRQRCDHRSFGWTRESRRAELGNEPRIYFVRPSHPARGLFGQAAARRARCADVTELGYADIISTTWHALSGPAGLPAEISARINREMIKILDRPDIRRRFVNDGVETQAMPTPRLNAMACRWGRYPPA
jgi:hypothetical protein